jgi:hypothetical protein
MLATFGTRGVKVIEEPHPYEVARGLGIACNRRSRGNCFEPCPACREREGRQEAAGGLAGERPRPGATPAASANIAAASAWLQKEIRGDTAPSDGKSGDMSEVSLNFTNIW